MQNNPSGDGWDRLLGWHDTVLAGLGVRFFFFGIRVNFTLLLQNCKQFHRHGSMPQLLGLTQRSFSGPVAGPLAILKVAPGTWLFLSASGCGQGGTRTDCEV